eukprot:superscaffoldBa00001119_g9057
MLGRVNIATQLDEGHRIGVRNTMKRGLVDFVASLDSVLEEHLKAATIFKGTSKTVQNELLDCKLSVLKDYILEEIKNDNYVAIQTDETTDIYTQYQLVLVLRYIHKKSRFIPLQNTTADTIATTLLKRLSTILSAGQESRLITQAYDGAAELRGATGVECSTSVDLLFNQLQKRNIDSVYITGIIQRFTNSMQTIRLNKAKLKPELSLVPENDKFKACSGALTLFQFFMENNLQGTFTETVSLLIITPMTTAQTERSFSSLNRIKTFLRITIKQDHLKALAVLSMEKKLIRNIPDSYNGVIERFATQKDKKIPV